MKILYATDGSEGGLTPGRFLAELVPGNETHVHIVTALPATDRDEGATVLAAAEKTLGDFAGKVTTETLRLGAGSTGDIAETLLEAADRDQTELIVLGASGHSAVAKFFLGSVAESVARHSRCPVLITRPLTAPLREIIIGFDGSDGSRAAAEFVACRLPLPLICRLRLAGVIPQPVFGVIGDPLYPGTPDYVALEMSNRKARSRVYREASDVADSLRRPEGGPTLEVEAVALGSPATELIRIADEHSAGLIVVGSHGLTKIERFLLGSVSERVMRHAHCSVLIVK